MAGRDRACDTRPAFPVKVVTLNGHRFLVEFELCTRMASVKFAVADRNDGIAKSASLMPVEVDVRCNFGLYYAPVTRASQTLEPPRGHPAFPFAVRRSCRDSSCTAALQHYARRSRLVIITATPPGWGSHHRNSPAQSGCAPGRAPASPEGFARPAWHRDCAGCCRSQRSGAG